MNRKSIGLVVLGVAGGCIAALLIQSGGSPQAPVVRNSGLERGNGDLQQKVAALTSELKALRARTGAAVLVAPKTPEEKLLAMNESMRKSYARSVQRETDQLLAAGFSMDRIQWLRSRSDQMEADGRRAETERRRAETERRFNGLPADKNSAYLLDTVDLDLINETGVDEYERYRLATGRRNGVGIASVVRGGIAESVGLKPGDQIIRYDGLRVYGDGQVAREMNKEARPGARVMIEILREGRPIRIEAPAGALDFSPVLTHRTRMSLPEPEIQSGGMQP